MTRFRSVFPLLLALFLGGLAPVAVPVALAQEATTQATTEHRPGGEVNIRLPDLDQVSFLGFTGHQILLSGIIVCILGLLFGLYSYSAVKKLPVHRSMAEVSDLIYETCKAYMVQQGRFLMILFGFIGAVIVVYFLLTGLELPKILIILLFSLIGMGGSYGVAWFGIRINTLANSRTAFASLKGKAWPVCDIPLRAGMSVGMMLISVELLFMLAILLFIPAEVAGACFLGFAIGESLGAAALRIAGGIFTKIADIGSDLMKVVFKIKEDDARNPGVIADCTGDNAGDSVGPTADGFETYGVTGVALITFIVLAVSDVTLQATLLVWIFLMRVMMVLASGASYLVANSLARARYGDATRFNFEAPLTQLVWLTSIVSVVLTYILSYFIIPDLNGNPDLWWQLSTVITCGTLAGAIIPEMVKVFTSTDSRHVREVVTSSREGGASLNILSGLVAGNFSAYWLGIAIMGLMAVAFGVSTLGLAEGGWMQAPAIFAFGLVAFGFLGMGPVTIAVDSYGPVTDNAQSVYELSTIEQLPNIETEVQRDFGFRPNFEVGKELLEENDGAGNTFKATAKPVLIGTAVVGATTLIFSIIMALTHGLTQRNREALDSSPAVPARPDHRRHRDLLVHRRLHPGGDHRRLPRGGVHQGQHPAGGSHQGLGRGQPEGGRDLHPVRPEGDVQHLPRRLLLDPRLRIRGAVLFHRLPDLHRALRPVSGDLHGQRRRGLGQRQEDRGDGAEDERHAVARRHGGRGYGRRSVQGHLLGRDEPGDQVHHPLRPAGR